MHAQGQVAHLSTSAHLNPHPLLYGLNALLPKDIRVRQIVEVPDAFHARYSAIGKEYHYRLHLEPVASPFDYLYSWHLREKLQLQLLKEAAALFLGTHDFTSFANEAHRGVAAHSPVRTIQKLAIVEEDCGVRLEFVGSGFLYKMVRNIVGTLVEVARGKRPIEDIPRLIAAKDRNLVGPAAPACGLSLVNVFYT